MQGKFDKLISDETPVLVDFYADWCGPCQALSPVLKEVANEFNGKVKVIKVNVDKNQPVANRFGINGIPHLIMFKKGNIAWERRGLVTKKELSELVGQVI